MSRLKTIAFVSLMAAAGMAVTSQVALAGTPVFDSCNATCGSGGGCSASSSWYQFWEDCSCGCTSSGTALCSCG